MAISFIGFTEFANGIANVTSAPLATPGGTADGDLMIAHITIRDEGFTITPPTGWTEIPIAVNETDHEARWYQRVASSEPGSRSWLFSGATATACGLLTFRGATSPHGSSVADGVAVLNHLTNSVTTLAANAWLLAGWSCQALVSLGWTPPGSMTERSESIGGLIILLNVEEMTATEGPLAVGTYSRTATTVDPIQAINSLLALEPILDPLVATPVVTELEFGDSIMGPPGLVGTPFSVEVVFGDSIVGPAGLNGAGSELIAEDGFDPATVVAGEVFIDGAGFELIVESSVPSGTVTPGEVFLGHVPWIQPQQHGSHTLTPGNVDLSPGPVFTFFEFGAGQEAMLGDLLSNEFPIIGALQAPDGTIGLGIIPGPMPRIEIVTGVAFGQMGMVYGMDLDFQGPCCDVP